MEEDRNGVETFMSIDKFISELIAYHEKIKELQASEVHYKLQTATLQETLDRYQTILDRLPQKIFLKDKNSLYLWTNEPYARYLGIPREEVPGRKDEEFFPPEAAGRSSEHDREVVEKGVSLEREERYASEGKLKVEKTITSPVKNASGETVGILGVCWDLTDQKAGEEEWEKKCMELSRLLEARGREGKEIQEKFESEQAERRRLEDRIKDLESQFSTLFESSGAAVAVVDGNQVISRVNGQFERFSGYSRVEVEGAKHWNEVFGNGAAENRGESAPPPDLLSREPGTRMITFLDRQNRGKTVSMNAARIADTDRIMVSLTDLTKYRQVREELDRIMRQFSEMMREMEMGEKA
jgi:PAS domain S-box-containing protein